MTARDDGFGRRIIEHLNRPPQDALEAAVVLEAWVGLSADDALSVGRATLARGVGAPPPRARVLSASSDRSLAPGDIGFVVGVLFIGFWVSHLATEFGPVAVDRAWRIALPASLGAQWALRRRYLAGPDGLGRLRAGLAPVAIPFLAVLAMFRLFGEGGWLAAALTLIWTGGFVLARRGWGLGFGIALVVGAVTLGTGLPAWWVLGVTMVAVVISTAAGLVTTPASPRVPAPWLRALPAGAIGAGLGLLLVVEPKFAWHAHGVLPALTVVPALLGSLWSGYHMTSLWEVLPAALTSATVSNRVGPRGQLVGRVAIQLLVGAVARLAAAAAIASAGVFAWVVLTREQDRRIVGNLLLAHAMLALAGLAVALVEAFGRWVWAVLAVAAGLATSLGLPVLVNRPTPGERIFFGAVAITFVAGPALAAMLRSPDRTIAAAI